MPIKQLIKTSIWFKRIADNASLRQFYAIYFVAFALIALIAFASQIFIQNFLGKQSEDSYLINVAGKQRMLSQKITKGLLFYSENAKESLKEIIDADLDYWSERHYLLSSDKLIHSKYNTPAISKKYKLLQTYFDSVFLNAKLYLVKKELHYLAKVTIAEKKYLTLMDEIVNDYDKNYQYKITLLRKIEFGLTALLIFILVLEMLLVFIPLLRTLSKSINKITISEQSARDLAKNLYQTNLNLKLKNKEVNDINLALDRAVMLIKTNPEGKIIYANEKYCLLTKYTLQDLISKPLFYNNRGGSESIIYDHIKDKKSYRNVWQSEVHDTASDGDDFWLDVTLFPVVNEIGELYEYLVICNDITKRKLAEEELELLNEKRFIKQEQDQRIKSRSIIEGQEVERRRMSAEVHDGLGQMLTALKFNCEALESEDHTQSAVIDNMKHLLQQVIIETRRISSDLLPTTLSDFGLASAIREMVNTTAKFSNNQIQFQIKIDFDDRLSNEKEIAIYRIAQESLNNALKHSKATIILISLKSDAEFLYLSVQDNGKGLENTAVKVPNSGNGLRNMKERAKLIDGKFSVRSLDKGGLKVSVEIPIA